MKHLILIGPPAAGKGTVSSKLVENHNYYQLSTGDLLREEVSKGTDLGNKIAALIDKGNMVSDQITLELMTKNLPLDKPIIFDGYPRNIAQAQLLEKELLPALGSKIEDCVPVFFDIDLDQLIHRVVNRRTCSKCGKIHHMVNFPPVNKDGTLVCSSCGAPVSHRKDDTEEAFPTRIETYKKITKPILELYKNHPLYISVKADGSIEEVYNQITKVLD